MAYFPTGKFPISFLSSLPLFYWKQAKLFLEFAGDGWKVGRTPCSHLLFSSLLFSSFRKSS